MCKLPQFQCTDAIWPGRCPHVKLHNALLWHPGQEMQRAYSYNPGVQHGVIYHRPVIRRQWARVNSLYHVGVHCLNRLAIMAEIIKFNSVKAVSSDEMVQFLHNTDTSKAEQPQYKQLHHWRDTKHTTHNDKLHHAYNKPCRMTTSGTVKFVGTQRQKYSTPIFFTEYFCSCVQQSQLSSQTLICFSILQFSSSSRSKHHSRQLQDVFTSVSTGTGPGPLHSNMASV